MCSQYATSALYADVSACVRAQAALYLRHESYIVIPITTTITTITTVIITIIILLLFVCLFIIIMILFNQKVRYILNLGRREPVRFWGWKVPDRCNRHVAILVGHSVGIAEERCRHWVQLYTLAPSARRYYCRES